MIDARSASLHLSPLASSCARARRFVRAVLAGWGLEGLADDAVLHTSELVANGVLHAGTDLTLTVRRDDGRIRVAVLDGSNRLPRLRSYAADQPGGRGLHIVAAGTQAWGVDPLPEGKAVWFELGPPDTARDPTANGRAAAR